MAPEDLGFPGEAAFDRLLTRATDEPGRPFCPRVYLRRIDAAVQHPEVDAVEAQRAGRPRRPR